MSNMSNAVPAGGHATARVTNIGLWVLQIGLAAQFAGAGYLKLTGAPAMIELFAAIGVGQWLRLVVGGLELAAAVGLLLSRLSGLTALGLTGLMAGAAATNQFVLGQSPWLPIGLLAAGAVVARGRWSRTRTLADRIRKGTH